MPLEDLDFDLPPQPIRPAFYNSDFGGPQPRQSFADSVDAVDSHSRLPSEHNPSFVALPIDRGYAQSTLSRPYYDNPSQANLDVPRDYAFPAQFMVEKRAMYENAGRSRKRTWLILAGLGLFLVIAAVALGVYFGVIKPQNNNSKGSSASNPSSGNSSSNGGGSGHGTQLAISGGNGSTITTDDGSNFIYLNSLGGMWYADPHSPFANNAQAQSYSPPLNQSWNWGVDRIYGVNLGGWLNTEPFITPSLFEPYANSSNPAVDEWTLSENLAADPNSGGLQAVLENHYKTFITEEDFAQISGAGLNWLRIPLPYWAIETQSGEPYLKGVAWKYFLKAIEWARKYGLRINVDYHAAPGSQNGWNHSGRLGSINVMNGVMGIANAQRTLNHIRIIAEFISQPQYKDIVPMFSILNEPQGSVVGHTQLASFYFAAYNVVREASGIGEGMGPVIAFHDAFEANSDWNGFLGQPDRICIDTHPYFAFGGQSTTPVSSFAPLACSVWGPLINGSMANNGMTVAGEFSLATNDCGLYVNGVNLGTRYDGTFVGGSTKAVGSCAQWDNWQNWTQDTKNQLMDFCLSSMDSLQNWFFWTWKIGNSTTTGTVLAPFWSYQLGLVQGWIPTDPRAAVGACKNSSPWQGPLQSYQTGGAGAGNIPASVSVSLVFPPATISNAGPASVLPSLTPTGPIPTLAPPIITAADPATTFNAGNGWANAQDTLGAYVSIAGCSYLDPWNGVGAPLPTAPCPNPNAVAAPAVTAST